MLTKMLDLLGNFATDSILPAVIVAVLGILTVRILARLLKAAFHKAKMDSQLSKLIVGCVVPALYVVLGLIVATCLGIDVTSIVALASVLTLAISLSLQNALANIFGGFTLLYTKPFVANDYVEIAGQSGTVKEVGLAYTRLATPDNKLISIPNSAVVAAEIVNYSVTGTRRLDINVNVDYSAVPEEVVNALLAAADIPLILQDPAPFAAMSGYGEGNVTYLLHVWVATSDYWTAKFAINKNIKEIFADRGIAMSCNHLNVHVEQ